MAKYRKKPVVVEAVRWFTFGDISLSIVRKSPKCKTETWRRCKECGIEFWRHGEIDTLEGVHIVCPGDWIITGVKGERYPCKPDIFEMTYEEVVE